MLTPDVNEREGYVPNVVYSCGAAVHNGLLIIPYAMADYATAFATVPLKQVLDAMRRGIAPAVYTLRCFATTSAVSCGDRSFRDDAAAIHDVEVLAELADEIEILLDDHDRQMQLVDELVQGVADLVDDARLNPFGRLVEQEDFRSADKGPGDGQLLLLTAREVAPHAAGHPFEHGEEGIDLFGNRARTVGPRFQADPQVFLDGELRKDFASLRHQGDACSAPADGPQAA